MDAWVTTKKKNKKEYIDENLGVIFLNRMREFHLLWYWHVKRRLTNAPLKVSQFGIMV